MSSPPQTPTVLHGPFQPSPCEPAYTTSTYKPPSLYPNKKQRTGVSPEHPPPLSTSSTLSSPDMGVHSFEQSHSRGASGCHPGFYAHDDAESLRRLSVQYPQTAGPPAKYGIQPPLETARFHSFEAGNQSTNGKLPPPSTMDTSRRGPRVSHDLTTVDNTLDRRPSMDYLSSQRSSRHDAQSMQDRPSLDRTSSVYRPDYTSKSSFDVHLEAERYRAREFKIGSHRPGIIGGYESSQPQYLVPTHYEYQHGKARKRSNLPKQSTEIMKTWFDKVSPSRRVAVTQADKIRTSQIHIPAKSKRLSFQKYVRVRDPRLRPRLTKCVGDRNQYDSGQQLVH